MTLQPRRGWLLPVAVLLVVALGCQSGGDRGRDAARPSEHDAFADHARAATNRLQLSLKRELSEALSAGEAGEAVAICREKAPRITVEVSRESSMQVGRVAVPGRTRNPGNEPTPAQAQVLSRFAEAPDLPDTVIVENGRLTYLRPIRIGVDLCLRCHGDRETMDPSVRVALMEQYPQDQATGFEMGDLRGAFVVREES